MHPRGAQDAPKIHPRCNQGRPKIYLRCTQDTPKMPVIDTTTARRALLGDRVHGLGEAPDGAAGHTCHAVATQVETESKT